MKDVKNPRTEWLVYAHSDRSPDRVKPSGSQRMPDGGDLYWLPVHVYEIASGRELDVTVFTANPLAVRFLDVVQLDGPHLIEMFGTGRNGIRAMYWFDHAQVIDHLSGGDEHRPASITLDGTDE